MTAPPISPVEEIAGRLSEAQRRAVIVAVTTRGIANRLLRTGLVRTTEACDAAGGTIITLTPLGLHVRDHLRATLNPEGTDHG